MESWGQLIDSKGIMSGLGNLTSTVYNFAKMYLKSNISIKDRELSTMFNCVKDSFALQIIQLLKILESFYRKKFKKIPDYLMLIRDQFWTTMEC